MVKIYTKTGDDGTTGLIGGKRVPKDSPHIEANGSLDELNALIGLARAHGVPAEVDGMLQSIQDDLFTIGAELATPEGTRPRADRIGEEEIRRLESHIDKTEAGLEPLKHFILPGGSVPGAQLHLARAVARRAERQCVSLSRTAKVDPVILQYLNRLSDLCFVLARRVNSLQSIPEFQPTYKKT